MKRFFYLLALFIPIFFYAQEKPCKYKVNEIDRFLKARVIKTDWIALTKENTSNLYFSLNRSGNKKYIIFKLDKKIGCVSSNSNNKSFVKVFLENGNIIKFNHFGDENCEDFNLYGRLTKDNVKKLKSSKIKSIKLFGTKIHDIVNIKNNEAFFKHLSCID